MTCFGNCMQNLDCLRCKVIRSCYKSKCSKNILNGNTNKTFIDFIKLKTEELNKENEKGK